jgi:PAS domain S-box-containing protein
MPYVSGAFRQMFGLSANEVREDATKALMRGHPDDVEGLMASIQMSAKDMTPWQHEYRLKFDDGTERWVFGNSLPQREVDGSVLWLSTPNRNVRIAFSQRSGGMPRCCF